MLFQTCKEYLSRGQLQTLCNRFEDRLLTILDADNSPTPGYWSYLVLYAEGYTRFLEVPCQEAGIHILNVLLKMPKLIIIIIERSKVSVSYHEELDTAVTISDLHRPILWVPTPEFDRHDNHVISSVGQVFEHCILQFRDPDLLRTYMSFPSTTVSGDFLTQLSMAPYNNPPPQDPTVCTVAEVLQDMAERNADHPEDNHAQEDMVFQSDDEEWPVQVQQQALPLDPVHEHINLLDLDTGNIVAVPVVPDQLLAPDDSVADDVQFLTEIITAD